MTVWIWNPRVRRLDRPAAGHDSSRLLAADSWYLGDGRVRALGRHRQRFRAAAEEVGVHNGEVDAFWEAAIARLPETGEWFPRVDVLASPSSNSPTLAFRLRPSPQRTRELRVLIPSQTDPRSTPHRKGPDIAVLEELRTRARTEHDCDEVLLLNEDGYVVEAATTSLLWWDGETLCVPDRGLGPLPGVTSAVIVGEARRSSIEVVSRRIRPEDLNGHEVWLVNALHGIRRVIEFVDVRSDSESAVPDRRRYSMEPAAQFQPGVVSGRFERWRIWLDTESVPTHHS